ncbi:MAG: beta-galactosidase [Armatimonadetes bacterium]|nr:beta-galactosidase [Armatimonadota bacterium]
MNRTRIIPKVDHILHGGDYYPEQWPREVWDEDMALMDQAHVNFASIGVFSWVCLEPEEGRYDFGWLDDLTDLLHKSGKMFCLATPSAAQPAWMSRKYPEILRVDPDGHRRKHGNRVNFCWTSPIYREKVQTMATVLAERYGGHPGLAFWHVSNEYGGECHCDLCRGAFRAWLRNRYQSLDALNEAYWAKFWSHSYTDWDEIEIPGHPHSEVAINGLTLDWKRFTTHQIVEFFKNESAPLRQHTPEIPVTTNLMGTYGGLDPWKLAPHLDFIAWDSYPGFIDRPMEVRDWVAVSFVHDLNRSMKHQPFLLIESTPSSSNWYPVMGLKRPGMHFAEGIQALAHGSEGVMYFQWRKSRGSQEQYHGAVVSHDGSTETRVFKQVSELGKELSELSDLRGATTKAQVALIYDWENAWAIEAAVAVRVQGKNYYATAIDQYRPFWEAGIPADIVDSDQDLSNYRLVIAPMLYMLKPGVADRISNYVKAGGTFVATYWTAMVDEASLNILGGYPGPLRKVFGLWVEDTDGLHDSIRVAIQAKDGNSLGLSGRFEARQYCDMIHAESAEVLATYGSEFYAGEPALTRNSFGEGEAYFIASRNDEAFATQFYGHLSRRLGLVPALDAVLPVGVTAQARAGETQDYVFLQNFSDSSQTVVFNKPEDLTEQGGGMVGATIVLEPFGTKIFTKSQCRQASEPLSR